MGHAFEVATGTFAIEATHKKDTMDRCDECGAEKPKFGYANSPELFCEDCYFSKIKGTPREANIIKKAQHKMDVAPASSGTCVSKGCGKPATQTLTTPHYPEDGKTSSNSFCKEHGDQIRNAYGHSAQHTEGNVKCPACQKVLPSASEYDKHKEQHRVGTSKSDQSYDFETAKHTDDRQWKPDATDKTKSGGYWSSPAGKQELRQAEKIKKLYPNVQKEAQHEGKPGCKTCGGSGSVKANAWGSERCPKCNPNPYNAKHENKDTNLNDEVSKANTRLRLGYQNVFGKHSKEKLLGKLSNAWKEAKMGYEMPVKNTMPYKDQLAVAKKKQDDTKSFDKEFGIGQHEEATGKFAEGRDWSKTGLNPYHTPICGGSKKPGEQYK